MSTNANVNRSDESVGTARLLPPDNASVRAALRYARFVRPAPAAVSLHKHSTS